MPRNKKFRPGVRSQFELERDLAIEMDMYMHGATIYKIAKHIGISHMQVHRDLAKLRAEWKERAHRKLEEHLAEELKKLDYLEAEAYDAWERSKEDAKTIETTSRVATALRTKAVPRVRQGNPNKKTETKVMRVQGQYGDPRLLAIVYQCISKRSELLGIAQGMERADGDQWRTQEDVRNLIIQRLAQLAPPSNTAKQSDVENPNDGSGDGEPIDIKAETIQ